MHLSKSPDSLSSHCVLNGILDPALWLLSSLAHLQKRFYHLYILSLVLILCDFIIRKSKFPLNPERSVQISGKRTKRSVQKKAAHNTYKAGTKG